MATGSSNPDDVIHIEEPKRKIGCVPMAIVAVSSAVACILLGAFFWNLAATQRLKENLDALGKAGYPSSFADFAEKVTSTNRARRVPFGSPRAMHWSRTLTTICHG